MDSITTYRPPEFDQRGRLFVSGFDLRYALTAILAAECRPMTVADLGKALASSGLVPRGRSSKSISDALYREIGKGRVSKVKRSVYRIDRVPHATLWRIRRHVGYLTEIQHSRSSLAISPCADNSSAIDPDSLAA